MIQNKKNGDTKFKIEQKIHYEVKVEQKIKIHYEVHTKNGLLDDNSHVK